MDSKVYGNGTIEERNINVDLAKFFMAFLIVAIHVGLFKENNIAYSIATHIEECAMLTFSVIM